MFAAKKMFKFKFIENKMFKFKFVENKMSWTGVRFIITPLHSRGYLRGADGGFHKFNLA